MSALHLGDCRDVLPQFAAASIDAVVTDPPYGLQFMDKGWDHGVPGEEFWREVGRTMKPGAFLLAFGGSRTYHRLACAVEDAGFEIRDQLQWLYGSGFPKSLDVSKAIDKAHGAEREVVGDKLDRPGYHLNGHNGGEAFGRGLSSSTPETRLRSAQITAPTTGLAQRWHGFGTALKPAHEPIVLARKPLVGTVAANVAQHGTGALNIDECRIETDGERFTRPATYNGKHEGWSRPWMSDADALARSQDAKDAAAAKAESLGRWPANVVLDEDAAALLDAQSGERKSGGSLHERSTARNVAFGEYTSGRNGQREPDTGGASRFFYCAKASRSERNAGLEGMPARVGARTREGTEHRGRPLPVNANHHPTVKPLALMRWLVRLITPPGGTVLDPFAGSGTTGCACEIEGVDYVLIDEDAEYLEIARRRTAHYAAISRRARTRATGPQRPKTGPLRGDQPANDPEANYGPLFALTAPHGHGGDDA